MPLSRVVFPTFLVLVCGCNGPESTDSDSDGTTDGSGTTQTDPTTAGPTTGMTAGETTADTVGPSTTSDTTSDTTFETTSTVGETETDSDSEQPPLDCSDDGWTCVVVEPTGPYGEHAFEVPAAQNWVNTGLYLQQGQQAVISETGTWYVNDNAGNGIDHGPCVIGDLVARIGLHYKDPALTCVAGDDVMFTADKDGILYLGALPSNDLGETYETRVNASGFKQVTVQSDGETVPTIEAELAAQTDFDAITSGWVEVRGTHTILTLPTIAAAQDAHLLADALELIDAFYDLHAELRGALPQHGQRIRFFPDPNIMGIGYMLAGNPVRMDPILVDAGYGNRISNAGEPGVDVWGFAHELGHDFTFVNALWWYQENSLESWPNIFSIHALQALGIPLHDNALACEGGQPVAYDNWDAWSGLCFLLYFQQNYGFEFYAEFFAILNDTSAGELPGGPMAWHWVHDHFEEIAGVDITPVFNTWSVPNPG